MVLRLHRHGQFRAWLGRRFGGDQLLGDRIWRRTLHGFGAAVLVYYLIPPRLLVVVSSEVLLFAALLAILLLELLRHSAGVELPTIRTWEQRWVASYTFYAVALVLAVLLFREAIAVAVVLGAAVVDPLMGEHRSNPKLRRFYPVLPALVYLGLALIGCIVVGRWTVEGSLVVGGIATAVAIGVEHPMIPYLDDDLTMVLLPGLVVSLLLLAMPGLPSLAAH